MTRASGQVARWLMVLLAGLLIMGSLPALAARTVCTGTVAQCLPVADDWVFDGAVIDDTSLADVSVVQLADGQWRLYVEKSEGETGSGYIASYISADGLAWQQEEGHRLADNSVYDVFVIGLSDGRWRLYYLDRAGQFIGSAVSADGLTFTDEGRTMGIQFWADRTGTEMKGMAVVRRPDGKFRMYVNLTKADGTSVVVSAPVPRRPALVQGLRGQVQALGLLPARHQRGALLRHPEKRRRLQHVHHHEPLRPGLQQRKARPL